MLKLLGAGAGAAAIGSVAHVGATQSDAEPSFVLEQGDRCVELTPLSGDEPVEEFYDYRYPTATYDSVSGSNGYTYSSEGTTHLQEDNTSILFLYDGPDGLSLVVVHGHLDGEEDNGGVVTFTFEGMPGDADWVVRDDYYTIEGEQAPTNHDRWDVDGDTHQIDWGYRFDRTDGGAARGLGESFEFTIDPAFNDDAALAEDHPTYGPIEAWKALSGDAESPDRVSLALDEPVTIRAGTCEDSAADDPTDTPDDEPTDTPEDQPTDTPEDEPTDTPDEPTDVPDDKDGGKDKDDEKEGC